MAATLLYLSVPVALTAFTIVFLMWISRRVRNRRLLTITGIGVLLYILNSFIISLLIVFVADDGSAMEYGRLQGIANSVKLALAGQFVPGILLIPLLIAVCFYIEKKTRPAPPEADNRAT